MGLEYHKSGRMAATRRDILRHKPDCLTFLHHSPIPTRCQEPVHVTLVATDENAYEEQGGRERSATYGLLSPLALVSLPRSHPSTQAHRRPVQLMRDRLHRRPLRLTFLAAPRPAAWLCLGKWCVREILNFPTPYLVATKGDKRHLLHPTPYNRHAR